MSMVEIHRLENNLGMNNRAKIQKLQWRAPTEVNDTQNIKYHESHCDYYDGGENAQESGIK